jgi:hypothetical protein
MTTALTVGFRAELSCSALSRYLLSFWSPSRRPRSWVSLARCSEGFVFIGDITAAIITITRGPTTRVIADASAWRTIAVMVAVAVVEGTAAVAVLAAADNSAKADFNAGRGAA